MPQRPYVDPVEDAKAFLARIKGEPWAGGAPTPTPTPAPSPLRTLISGKPAAPPEGAWETVKKVAHYSPLPEDIGSQFVRDVTRGSRQEQDVRAARGEGYGAGDWLKDFAAGAGGGFLDLLRGEAQPLSLATLATKPVKGAMGVVGDVVSGGQRVAGGVLGAEGIEQMVSPDSNWGQRGQGLLKLIQGGVGALSGRGMPSGRPAAVPPPPRATATVAAPRAPRLLTGETTTPPPSFLEGEIIPPGAGAGNRVPASASPAPAPAAAPSPSPLRDLLAQPSQKPRMTAPEVRSMLAGREKFAAKTGSAPAPNDTLDRMGVEYGRTQSELKRLLGLGEAADPTELARMQQGARELGSRLRRQAKATAEPPTGMTVAEPVSMVDDAGLMAPPEPAAPSVPSAPPTRSTKIAADVLDKGAVPKPPVGVTERRYNEMVQKFGGRRRGDPQAGATDPELLVDLASMIGGAGIGSYYGGDHPLLGGAAGAAAGLGLRRGKGNIERLANASMLSSPLTPLKVGSGNLGGMLIRAAQKAAQEGDPSYISSTLRELVDPATVTALKRGYNAPHMGTTNTATRTGTGYAATGPLSWPGRTLSALDTATKSVMGRAGFTPQEAARVAMTAEPQTPALKDLLNLQRKHAIARVPFPFMKTQLGQLEQGLVEPAQGIKAMLEGKGTKAGAIAATTALAAGGAGYASDQLPGWAQPLAVAATGPYAAPAALGNVISKIKPNVSPLQKLLAAYKGLTQQLPLAEQYDLDPRQLLARLVPNVSRDVAEAIDPYERETSKGLLDRLLSKIPFVREQLRPTKRKQGR